MLKKEELTETFFEYFDLYRFDSPDERGSHIHMDTDFLNRLADARYNAGTPFVISSGIEVLTITSE